MKICPFPFSKLELGTNFFIPCCYSWLHQDFFKSSHDGDLWNSKAAQLLRQKMYNGDYSLCNRNICNIDLIDVDKLSSDDLYGGECKISADNITAIKKNQSILPGGPSCISLAVDKSCNLSCPSCRKTKQTSSPSQETLMQFDHLLKLYSKSVSNFKIAGDGEVFFSSWYREILKNLSKESYPLLSEVVILTNGTLLTPQNYQSLLPGIDYVKHIWISIDAATQKTYSKVRGECWNQLLENLNFVKSLRQCCKIKTLNFSFVPRLSNFEEMEDFLYLATKYGADTITYNTYTNWHSGLDYHNEAVHLSTHPRHNDFIQLAKRVRQDPRVIFHISI